MIQNQPVHPGEYRIVHPSNMQRQINYYSNLSILMGNHYQPSVISQDLFNNYINADLSLNQHNIAKTQPFTPEVKLYIDQHQPFQLKHINYDTFSVLDSGQLYQGPIDTSGNPAGFGRLLKNNDSVLFADFLTGKAQGVGLCIFKDGSTYEGHFSKGKASGVGKYSNKDLSYEGHFDNNQFQGQGKLATKNGPKYELEGKFLAGKIVLGKLTWEDPEDTRESHEKSECIYEGGFNKQSKFVGEGTLQTSFGKYSGSFKNGEKEGLGKFQFNNGLLFVGNYINGSREGFGTIYNAARESEGEKRFSQHEHLVAYKGQFQNDLPHGDGEVFDVKSRSLIRSKYENGVNSESKILRSTVKKSQIRE